MSYEYIYKMYYRNVMKLFLQFGRKKKKYRGKAVGPASILKEVEDKESEGEEEDEDEDLSKYKLDEVIYFFISHLSYFNYDIIYECFRCPLAHDEDTYVLLYAHLFSQRFLSFTLPSSMLGLEKQ